MPPTNAGLRFEALESFEHSDMEEPMAQAVLVENTGGLVQPEEPDENNSSDSGSETVADSASSTFVTSPSDGTIQLNSSSSSPSFRDPGSTCASVDSNMGDKIDNVWRCNYRDCDKTFRRIGDLK
jgi:hypothetical protein